MRVHFTNLGCKLNQAEVEALARGFLAAGHEVVPSLDSADLHVVNTCTVTHAAARDSRKIARRGRRLRPELRTVLTGCYAEAEPEEAAALAGVDLVVPNGDKASLLEAVHRRFPEALPIEVRDPSRAGAAATCLAPLPADVGNSRALVKIEDGCNMKCAFCIIPSTRGRQTSRAPEDVLREVTALVDAGFHEVVVTGVQISSYRYDHIGLYELVERLLGETCVGRLRLTSIAPWQFDHRILDLFASRRLCRHFHLSLQSGAAETLRRMRRPYTPDEFRGLIETIRHRVPGVALTTDVIVGFPGETDEEFEESLAFVASIGFARVHAFPFSSRPGTEAAAMPGQVDPPVKRERMKRMLEVAAASSRAFLAGQVGARVEVLWEQKRDGRWMGTTDNYIRTARRSALHLAGEATVEDLEGVDGDLVWVAHGGPAADRPAVA